MWLAQKRSVNKEHDNYPRKLPHQVSYTKETKELQCLFRTTTVYVNTPSVLITLKLEVKIMLEKNLIKNCANNAKSIHGRTKTDIRNDRAIYCVLCLTKCRFRANLW